jgi:hypothetical protein
MSDDFLLDTGLRFEGFTDQQIAQIQAAIPQAQALVALIEKNEVTITAALELITQVQAQAKELLPIADMILTKFKEKTV